MKYSLICLASLLYASNAWTAPPQHDADPKPQQNLAVYTELLRAEVDLSLAKIRSAESLHQHLANEADSPLSALSPHARIQFIDRLVFTEHGLGSFSVAPLDGHSVTSAYLILQLFGAQGMVGAIEGLLTKTATDEAIIELTLDGNGLAMIGRSCEFVFDPWPKWACVTNPGSMCDPRTCR